MLESREQVAGAGELNIKKMEPSLFYRAPEPRAGSGGKRGQISNTRYNICIIITYKYIVFRNLRKQMSIKKLLKFSELSEGKKWGHIRRYMSRKNNFRRNNIFTFESIRGSTW